MAACLALSRRAVCRFAAVPKNFPLSGNYKFTFLNPERVPLLKRPVIGDLKGFQQVNILNLVFTS